MSSPLARPAAIAEDSEHPVPWVFLVAMRGAASAMMPSPSNEIVDALAALPVAALDQHGAASHRQQPPALALRSRLSLVATGSSSSAAASGRFGVISEARGMSSLRKPATASGASRRSPEVATITGSSTTCFGDQRASAGDDGLDGRALRHHADLDGLDVEIGEYRIDLRGDEIGRHRDGCRCTPVRVLRGQRRDHGGAIDAERGKGLQVGLDAGAAGRIRAGNGERDGIVIGIASRDFAGV